jgi:hypothetical protein
MVLKQQKPGISDAITPLLVCFLPVYRQFGGKQAHWPHASMYFRQSAGC